MSSFKKGDENWSRMRKVKAQAFYKNRLAKLMEVLKGKLSAWIDEINTEIDANPNHEAIVDIGYAFEKLFCRNIVHTCFGEDVSDMEIEIDFRKDLESSEFIRRRVSLGEAIHEVEDATFKLVGFKWLNPVY